MLNKAIGLIAIIAIIFIVSSEANVWSKDNGIEKVSLYVSGDKPLVLTYNNLDDLNAVFIPRGVIGTVLESETIYGINFSKITLNNNVENNTVWIERDKLVDDLRYAALEKEVYVRTTTHLFDSMTNGDFIGVAKKGTKFNVIGAKLDSDGNAIWYKLKNDDLQGYARGKYFVLDKEDSLLRYSDVFPLYKEVSVRGTCSNCFGGSATSLDFFPRNKVIYDNNEMPSEVISWYIPSESLSNIDEFIDLAKNTKVNSFVVDIKDDSSPSYRADTMKKYSLKNYYNGQYSKEEYGRYIKKIKDAGYYVIGRITVFKDAYYAYDNPEHVISDKLGNPLEINRKYWPSPYQRDVWKFNVELAKESVRRYGFNEINFDYIRFPDRTQQLVREGKLDERNQYGEERAEVIQLFTMYAYDELSDLEAYVSGDVFGESAHTYVTDYGQYWPALSNVLDVISPMPYPDHFGNVYEGYEKIVKPWEQPYKILKVWGASAKRAQEETPSKAIVRSWILHQDTMQGYIYNNSHLEDQVKGLYENGLDGGYMPWNAYGSIYNYKRYLDFYKK